MEEIAISKFKATCLAVIKRVKRTRKPIRVTRFGEALVEIVPASVVQSTKRQLGAMQGTGRIVGDIVSPIGDESDWEAAR